jgi:hypothetical protein
MAEAVEVAGSWNVKVSGHRFDLADMRDLLQPPHEVVEIDGATYLRIGGIDVAPDASEAQARAIDIVARVNGALDVAKDDAQLINVENIVVRIGQDGSKTFGLLAATGRLTIRGRAALTGAAADGRVVPPAPTLERRLTAAAHVNPTVGRVLTVMGSGCADRLYRTWELICDDVGYDDVIAMMACTQVQLQRFTATLNSPRHEVNKGPPPGGYMSPAEIKAFSRQMLGAWLHRLGH